MTDLANKLAVRNATPDTTTPTIFDLIEKQKGAIARALPKHLSSDRFARLIVTELRRNPRLASCTPASLLGAVMLSAQLGLEPGPLGHVYLVPYGKEITLIVGYKGLIDLVRRSGEISSFYAAAVFEGDEFTWQLGTDRSITHRPHAADRDNPQHITHVYAVARYKNGGDPDFEVMTRAEIEKIRVRSRAKDNGPWVTDWQAMASKTVVRRLARWLPMSIETATAIAADETVVRDMPTGDLADVLDVDPIDDTEEGSQGE